MTRKRIAFWVALVVPWLLVAAHPGTRTLLLALFRGGMNYIPQPQQLDYAALSQQFPDDLQIQVGIAKQGQTTNVPASWNHKGATRAYRLGQTMQRFPHESLPVADYLRFSLGWLRDDRLAGDLENTQTLSQKMPAPERITPAMKQQWGSREFPNFTQQELNTVIGAARTGQRLEPNNAYYDWCLATLLLKGGRDQEALRALHIGSLKSHYNEHILESTAASIATEQKLRPLILEDKLSVLWSELLPHLTASWHSARLLSWRALKWERAGHHRETIALRADLARMGALMGHEPRAELTQDVGFGIQRIAWHHDSRVKIQGGLSESFSDRAIKLRSYAQDFARYARAHGSARIADETLTTSKETSRLLLMLQHQRNTLVPQEGLRYSTLFWVRASWWLSVGLFWLSGLLGLLCLVLSPWLWRTATQESPQTQSAAAWCVLLTALAAWGALRWGVPNDGYLPAASPNGMGSYAFEDGASGFFVSAFFLIPILVSLFICFVPVWFQMQRSAFLRRKALKAQAQEREPRYLPRDLRPYFLALLKWSPLIPFLYALIVWYGFLPSAALGLTQMELASYLVFIGFYLLVPNILIRIGMGLYRWRLKWTPTERTLTYNALRRYHAALCVMLLTTSWLYLATLWLGFIPRHQAEVQFAHFLSGF